MLPQHFMPHTRRQEPHREPVVTVEPIAPGVWRAAYRDSTGTVLMTEEAPTADLAFTRLRERSMAAGHVWTTYGADEP